MNQISTTKKLWTIRLCFVTILAGVVPNNAIAQTISVKSVTIGVLQQAEIPARDTGALIKLSVRPGDTVGAGEVIGSLDDREAKLAVSEAETQLKIAVTEFENNLAIKTAEVGLAQEEAALKKSKASHRIASDKASDDVLTRLARKNQQIALAELSRAQKSKAAFNSSVSQAEIDRLQASYDRTVLEIEKEESGRRVAKLLQDVEQASLDQQGKVLDQAKIELDNAKRKRTLAEMALKLKRQALELAQLKLDRRMVRAPFSGVIVEQFRHPGEWVEPGVKVVRMVGLDTLKAEGFVDSREIKGDIRGAKVEVQVVTEQTTKTYQGVVSFVNPEIDSVNQQVRVTVDIDNKGRELRPGMQAAIVIHPNEIVKRKLGAKKPAQQGKSVRSNPLATRPRVID